MLLSVMNQMLFFIQVNESIAELARLLHGIELREMEHLKFLRILLKDFMVISGIGTKNWSLIELATVLKMICYRGSSYEVYHPNDVSHNVLYVFEYVYAGVCQYINGLSCVYFRFSHVLSIER
jgi:hypothetical protein